VSASIVYAPLTVAALRELKLPPRRDLVDGLLPEGQVTLFTAREKSGKTLIATDLACAIALEQPFLDRAVRGGTVVFIPLEENIREVRHRILERIGKGYDDATISLLVLPANGYTDTTFRLDNAACMSAFTTLITDHTVDVVIIDTMREAHGLRENESGDMAALIRPLRQIAHATNCAIILIHHQSKAGTSRGSTAIAAGADQLWTFERTDRASEGSTANLTGILRAEGRFGPPVSLALRLGEGLRWVAVNQAATVLELSSRERILAALECEPEGMTAPEIAKETGIRLKTVQNEISRLLKEQPSPIVASGRPARTSPRRYLLTNPTLFPNKQTRTIVPTTATHRGEDSGTIPPDHSHGSRNDGNDEQPDAQPIVPESQAPRETGVGNDPARCSNCGSRLLEDGSACEVCSPQSGNPAEPYVEVVF
jgi:DNA-binding NarL/FixJ family response regulator